MIIDELLRPAERDRIDAAMRQRLVHSRKGIQVFAYETLEKSQRVLVEPGTLQARQVPGPASVQRRGQFFIGRGRASGVVPPPPGYEARSG